MVLSPEKRLRYLQQYMEEWVDLYPKKPKPFIFERWVESRVQKRINKGLHEHNQKQRKICVYCKRPFDDYYTEKTKDHVIPMSKGGYNVKENRRSCCFDCNQWKADKMPEAWLKEITKLIKSNRKIHEPYSKELLGIRSGNIRRVIREVSDDWTKVSLYKF